MTVRAMLRKLVSAGLWLAAFLACAPDAHADWDLTLFLGRAFPAAEDRLVLRAPGVPSLPGVDITASGTPEIRADGGSVFGAALALEAGVIGIEGRLDTAEVGFDLIGARYDFRITSAPLAGAQGSLTLGDGRFEADRLTLMSLNLRLRTPGPVGLIASGGLSYLPSFEITGTTPAVLDLNGLTVAAFDPRLRLMVAPGESEHRFGVNGGAGLRIGGGRLAIVAEARVFYFREYELRFALDDAPGLLNDLLADLEPIAFEPVLVNAQAGVVIRF